MLLDVLGRTRTTMRGPVCSASKWRVPAIGTWLGIHSELIEGHAWDCHLQLSATNEECLVQTGHQPVWIESLPFVHTARRCY